jgi:TMEM175 potassium channel family protein
MKADEKSLGTSRKTKSNYGCRPILRVKNAFATKEHPAVGKNRLEAFFDGVVAIIITIMVLEMKVPHGDSYETLIPLVPVMLSYVLSFIYLGIYWNNHHHMLHAGCKVTGSMLWANLYLLFWLSLIPITTGWMGENHFATLPVAVYGLVLLMAAIAYFILQQRIIASQGEDSILKQAIGRDVKGKLSTVLYLSAIGLAFISQWIAVAIYVIVALMWVVPDRRVERMIATPKS